MNPVELGEPLDFENAQRGFYIHRDDQQWLTPYTIIYSNGYAKRPQQGFETLRQVVVGIGFHDRFVDITPETAADFHKIDPAAIDDLLRQGWANVDGFRGWVDGWRRVDKL